MAAPQSLRLAIEACRPSKSSVMRLRSLPCSNHLNSATRSTASSDTAPGFPRSQSRSASTISTPPNNEAALPMSRSNEGMTRRGESALTTTTQPQSSQTTLQQSKPLPPNVLATYRVPGKHTPQYGLPVASLQLRSYSVRNLEFFADFCLRAAFYLKLPASGPVPLPRKTERWTTLRSNFIYKKSQENFERITYRRLITIMDGHADTVERWLAFVRKWQFYGVGMKANVWEFSSLDVGEKMDQTYKDQVEKELSEKLKEFGFNKTIAEKTSLDRLLRRQGTKVQGVPMAEVRERSLTEQERMWDQGLEVDANKALSDR